MNHTPRHASASRAHVSALLGDSAPTVLIIGGGINGIATFRDLALQGVRVLLVERGDWCSGASSASSHMIHGGIRYLEQGEFRLVRESVQERNSLIHTAPHYVKPLPTTMPIFSTFSGILAAPLRFLRHGGGKPNERGAILIKIGMTIYDTFSRGGASGHSRVPRHRFIGRTKSLAVLPKLNPNIKYTATYYDASMHDPERLALDVLFDGLAAGEHAQAINYVAAVGYEAGEVVLRDRRSGDEYRVRPRVIVNTSGPWTDLTNAALGQPSAFMGGTKGSHIVLNNPELLRATGGRELFFEHRDGRIVLIYPIKGNVMVGTTDIDADPSETSLCTEAEIDYFFDLVSHVFPTIAVTREQIVYRFSGIRPLPKHDDTQPGFVSRDYRIEQSTLSTPTDKTVLFSLVGGKWTTFRALAEHLSTEITRALGVRRTVSTVGLAIGGGRGYPRDARIRADWVAAHRGTISPERATQLLERYGTHAAALLEHLTRHGDDALKHAPEYSAQELTYLIEREHVVTLSDIVKRRTSLAFVGAVTTELITELADLLTAVHGLTHAQRATHIAEVIDELNTLHGLQLQQPNR